jgi:hypothetical protein
VYGCLSRQSAPATIVCELAYCSINQDRGCSPRSAQGGRAPTKSRNNFSQRRKNAKEKKEFPNFLVEIERFRPSYPRKRVSRGGGGGANAWIPAFAGMTSRSAPVLIGKCSCSVGERRGRRVGRGARAETHRFPTMGFASALPILRNSVGK